MHFKICLSNHLIAIVRHLNQKIQGTSLQENIFQRKKNLTVVRVRINYFYGQENILYYQYMLWIVTFISGEKLPMVNDVNTYKYVNSQLEVSLGYQLQTIRAPLWTSETFCFKVLAYLSEYL